MEEKSIHKQKRRVIKREGEWPGRGETAPEKNGKNV